MRALNEQNAQFAAGKIGQAPTGGPQELVYTITTKGRLSEPREFENIIVRANPDGSAAAAEGRGARRTGLQGLRLHRPRQRQGSRPWSAFSCSPAPTRWTSPKTSTRLMKDIWQALPAGNGIPERVRHHALRRGVDPRSGEDAARSDGAGVPGGVPVPAELARDADPVRRRAGIADRHLRRAATARLLDQHADAVRHGAGDRHRRRRRHRGAGERRAHHARGAPAMRAKPRSRPCAKSPARSSPSC